MPSYLETLWRRVAAALTPQLSQNINTQTGGGMANLGTASAGRDFAGRDLIIYNYGAVAPVVTDLAAKLDDYLRYVRDTYGFIKLSGIERSDQKSPRIPINKAYVPLKALRRKAKTERGQLERGQQDIARVFGRQAELREDGQMIEMDVQLNEVLAQGQRLIIVGGPGSGKSTVLQHVAWALAASLLDDKDIARQQLGLEATQPTPLPIYLPLSQVARYRREAAERRDRELPSLVQCVSLYLRGKELYQLPDNFFETVLNQGKHVMLLLDGLDEIADEEERRSVRAQVEDFLRSRTQLQGIVTCRTAAYQDKTALSDEFQEITVEPLADEHAEAIVRQYYHCLIGNATEAGHRADDLLQQVQLLEGQRRKAQGADYQKLLISPLMIRLLIIVHFSEKRLPDHRVALLQKAIEQLIQADYGPDENASKEIRTLIGNSWEGFRNMAQRMAFALHSQGKVAGRDMNESDLRKALAPEYQIDREDDRIDKFIRLAKLRGGLIEERAQSYRFSHHNFQEYLTARHIKEVIGSQGEVAGQVAAFFEAEQRAIDPWWREVALLTLGYSATADDETGKRMMRRFAGLLPPKLPAAPATLSNDMRLAMAYLAAQSVKDWKDSDRKLMADFAGYVKTLFEDEDVQQHSQPIWRATLGDALGRLGDPRFGGPDHLCLPAEPDFGLIKVPAGAFYMGTRLADAEGMVKRFGWEMKDIEREIWGEPLHLDTYYLARYPTTVAQFRVFCHAPDNGGFAPRDARCLRDPDTRPVRFVTWVEAMRYCQWLNEHLKGLASTPDWLRSGLHTGRYRVTLPNEAEWEKAARGGVNDSDYPRRIFTYGDQPDPNCANVGETGIDDTSAVGCFARGRGPYGHHDLLGNVDEWQRNIYAPYPFKHEPEDEDNILNLRGRRVVRGGAFNGNQWWARCADRVWYLPDYLLFGLGFRVVVSPVS